MKKTAISALFSFSLFVLSGCGPKQVPLSGKEISEAAKFFGGNTNFSVTVTSMFLDSAGRPTGDSPVVMTLVFSNGKRRHEMPNSAAPVTIYRPDTKALYEFWQPDKVMVEYRVPEGDKFPILHLVKEKSDLGEETINGHPCVKCRVLTQEEEGIVEWTTWEATDLNRFPIRAENLVAKRKQRLEFSNVVLTTPDLSLFEAPKGYRKFKNKVDAANYLFQKGQERAK